jgi:hypothetical protein
MNELSMLQSLGLTLPTPAYIFGAILFGIIGIAAFRAGRKSGRKPTLWLGVTLMFYPYAVSSTWLLYAMGLALCAGLYMDRA